MYNEVGAFFLKSAEVYFISGSINYIIAKVCMHSYNYKPFQFDSMWKYMIWIE